MNIERWQMRWDGHGTLNEQVMYWSERMAHLVPKEAGAHHCAAGQWLGSMLPGDRSAVADALRCVIDTGTPRIVEYRLMRRAGGARRRILSHILRVPHPAGGKYLVLGSEQLMADCISLAQEGDTSFNFPRLVLDSSALAVCVINRHFRLVYANPAFHALIQLQSPMDDAEIDIRRLLPADWLRRRVLRNLRRSIRGEHRVETTSFPTAAGNREYDLDYLPLMSALGECIGVRVRASPILAKSPSPDRRIDTAAHAL